MIWPFNKRTVTVPVEVPQRYGSMPDLSELKAALEGEAKSEQVRAFVHLLLMVRTQAGMSARAYARSDKPAGFDLGGQDYLDALYSHLDTLITGAAPDEALKAWFEQGK